MGNLPRHHVDRMDSVLLRPLILDASSNRSPSSVGAQEACRIPCGMLELPLACLSRVARDAAEAQC